MAFKLINATEAKTGTNIVLNGAPCIVKKMDISKTGKHGHAKCRIEAVGLIDGKKRVIVVPGHERFEVPRVEKKKGQILSISDNKANIMDIDSYETFDILISDEIKEQIKEGDQVEYWNIEGEKIVKRKV